MQNIGVVFFEMKRRVESEINDCEEKFAKINKILVAMAEDLETKDKMCSVLQDIFVSLNNVIGIHNSRIKKIRNTKNHDPRSLIDYETFDVDQDMPYISDAN